MAKYKIRTKEEEKTVEVTLEHNEHTDEILLKVGRFYVFTLNPNGTGRLNQDLVFTNDEDLQTDGEGRIRLV